MLRRTATAAAAVLAVALTPGVAHADTPGGGLCDGLPPNVTVCASDGGTTPGSGGGGGGGTGGGGGGGGGGGSAPVCTYDLLSPQPPADDSSGGGGSLSDSLWNGNSPEDGALYNMTCLTGPDGTPVTSVVFVPTGLESDIAAVPQVDPEVLARRAVDSMRLDGPVVASPRAAGTYLIGMPMWMWATPSPATFGPQTASATAGSVTVTATAKVTSVRWDMGDGTTVTCAGPGTPYRASYGRAASPTCGHTYERLAGGSSEGRYRGRATATWTVQWQAPSLGASGTLTEVRETPFTARVVEMQVVN